MGTIIQNRNERESNFELLRCILIMFVIILHYNNRLLGGALQYVAPGSVGFYFLYMAEAMAICAVNVFILISGYFLSTSKTRKINKGIYLLVSCVGYKLLSYGVNIAIGRIAFSRGGFLRTLVPDNYYVILYVTLFFVSFYVNDIIEHLDKKQYLRMLIAFVSIFVIWENLWDLIKIMKVPELTGISTVGMGGGQEGYTIVNFILLYLIAGYLKKWPISKVKPITWFGGYVVCTGIIFTASLITPTALFYNNLVVIAQSICLFKVFELLEIKYSKLINKLASTVFATYLFHLTIIPFFHIPEAAAKGGISMVINMMVCIGGTFAICAVVALVINWIMTPIKKKVSSMTDGIQL